MTEDWTDIIGEGLETVEEPLPADDWSVLQQKYAASHRRKTAAFFAWAGGVTSVAAAVALMLLLVRPAPSPSAIPDQFAVIPDQSVVIPDQFAVIPDPIGDLTAQVAAEMPSVIPDSSSVIPDPIGDPLRSDDTLVAEVTSEDGAIDIVRDTSSVTETLLADASPAVDDASPAVDDEKTGVRFEDLPVEEEGHRRIPVSIGISGAVSDSPVMGMMMDYADSPQGDLQGPPYSDSVPPVDTTGVDGPVPSKSMMRTKNAYTDSYDHDIPVSVGVSVRFHLTDRISINTGINYTRYTSTRNRAFLNSHQRRSDKQHVHYLGIPVRLDWMIVNRKYFNLYVGAGAQMDKCVHATVGDEILREKQFLFGVNGTVGVQVNIVPMLGLYLEPDVSYALNKGSIETFRSDEPFLFTARAGLRFNF